MRVSVRVRVSPPYKGCCVPKDSAPRTLPRTVNPNPNPNPSPHPDPHLTQVLPPRLPWLARAREALGRAPRWRVAGLVHVYLAPHARGTAAGAALMLGARRCLRRMGVRHELVRVRPRVSPQPQP